MRTVSAMDMRRRLGEILDAASAGERILIERDRRPLAYLVPFEDGQRLDSDREALLAQRMDAFDRLRAHGLRMRELHPPSHGGPTDAEWIQQERERRTEQIDRAARASRDDRAE